jgi:hypothetical protein
VARLTGRSTAGADDAADGGPGPAETRAEGSPA